MFRYFTVGEGIAYIIKPNIVILMENQISVEHFTDGVYIIIVNNILCLYLWTTPHVYLFYLLSFSRDSKDVYIFFSYFSSTVAYFRRP